MAEDSEGSVGERRLTASVESFGRHRMQIFKQGDPAIVKEIDIDVLLPPPDRSKTCN